MVNRWVCLDKHTSKYPPTHPVTIIPIATETLCEPNSLPTTVGIVAKKPPFEAPLMITNNTIGPSECVIGHMTKMLRVVKKSTMRRVFSGPSTSPAMPAVRRPIADETL